MAVPEAVVVAQQILSAALGADEDFQRADRVDNRTVGSALVDMSDLNSPFLSDGSQQLQQNPAVQGVEHIMMLMLEVIRLGFQLVQQRGANNTQRIFLGEKGDGVRPGLQVNGIRGAAIVQLPAALFRFQNSERHIFLQFLADCY